MAWLLLVAPVLAWSGFCYACLPTRWWCLAVNPHTKWVARTLDEKMPGLESCTLVCIPASSEEKTQARYEQFAKDVCKATGMANAYKHIKVEGDRLALHEHRVCKSISRVQVLKFNRNFFNGRKVIIFDDVITRGASFATMVSYLEEMGAQVVGGVFLAATSLETSKD